MNLLFGLLVALAAPAQQFMNAEYGRIPLSFESNQGQADPR